MRLVILFVAVIAALQAACTSVGQQGSGAAPPSQAESVFVLGVSPANHRVSFFRGSLDAGKFVQNNFLPAVVYSAPVDGYVVGRAAAGDAIAVTNVRVAPDSNAILTGTNFAPCGGATTIAFRVPAGTVAYLGSVNYDFRGDRLNVSYGNDLEAARAHIASKFPSLSGRVEYLPFELAQVISGCVNAPIYIPIYLPRVR